MNSKIKNMRGFTLVELLAVIVVLAIVMLIAVQAILPQMEKARRRVLALEATTAIDAAQTYVMSEGLTDSSKGLPAKDGDSRCVTIDTLITAGQFQPKGSATYTGKVVITKKGNIYLYSIWLQKDSAWMIVNAGSNGTTNTDINEDNVVDYDSGTWSTANGDTCS